MPPTVTLLDGGMGQELIRRGGDNPSPLWATRVMIDHPGLVQAIHADYFAAGASLATTNTYAIHHDRLVNNAMDHRFAQLHEAALDEAAAARKAHGTGLIAGSTGPLGASYRSDLMPPPEKAAALYAEIAAILAPRVDVIIGETLATLSNVRAFLDGTAQGAPNTPRWISVTVEDRDGTLLRSGEPLTDLADLAQQADAVLVNCSSPEAIDQAMPILATFGKPFGGQGNGFQQITSDFLKANPTVDALTNRPEMTPERYADFAMGWVAQGATLIGGCCETVPDHIAAIAHRLRAAGYPIA
ncbi:homocysteine S-methyltransferase family protein [Pararhodobacter zhoushanensis]|uniref:Homocysteine S-methyltransferase family protein n=1 Tax=Pararhodobacter zhoushanensis TaxID=2479545 RepID=A0ABT3GY89_9RHOB|nr:homocysteine S-methyltransferase family protein [Pararhodobacter zhoushanensis]MCW1932531.1 homocysteine S-methyltransferase family protein [Pararhodobacter zhoushanensis]